MLYRLVQYHVLGSLTEILQRLGSAVQFVYTVQNLPASGGQHSFEHLVCALFSNFLACTVLDPPSATLGHRDGGIDAVLVSTASAVSETMRAALNHFEESWWLLRCLKVPDGKRVALQMKRYGESYVSKHMLHSFIHGCVARNRVYDAAGEELIVHLIVVTTGNVSASVEAEVQLEAEMFGLSLEILRSEFFYHMALFFPVWSMDFPLIVPEMTEHDIVNIFHTKQSWSSDEEVQLLTSKLLALEAPRRIQRTQGAVFAKLNRLRADCTEYWSSEVNRAEFFRELYGKGSASSQVPCVFSVPDDLRNAVKRSNDAFTLSSTSPFLFGSHEKVFLSLADGTDFSNLEASSVEVNSFFDSKDAEDDAWLELSRKIAESSYHESVLDMLTREGWRAMPCETYVRALSKHQRTPEHTDFYTLHGCFDYDDDGTGAATRRPLDGGYVEDSHVYASFSFPLTDCRSDSVGYLTITPYSHVIPHYMEETQDSLRRKKSGLETGVRRQTQDELLPKMLGRRGKKPEGLSVALRPTKNVVVGPGVGEFLLAKVRHGSRKHMISQPRWSLDQRFCKAVDSLSLQHLLEVACSLSYKGAFALEENRRCYHCLNMLFLMLPVWFRHSMTRGLHGREVLARQWEAVLMRLVSNLLDFEISDYNAQEACTVSSLCALFDEYVNARVGFSSSRVAFFVKKNMTSLRERLVHTVGDDWDSVIRDADSDSQKYIFRYLERTVKADSILEMARSDLSLLDRFLDEFTALSLSNPSRTDEVWSLWMDCAYKITHFIMMEFADYGYGVGSGNFERRLVSRVEEELVKVVLLECCWDQGPFHRNLDLLLEAQICMSIMGQMSQDTSEALSKEIHKFIGPGEELHMHGFAIDGFIWAIYHPAIMYCK